MKKTWMWCLVTLLSLGTIMPLQAQTGGTEKAVAALEQQWLQSQKTNNPDLVGPLIADKFIGTGVDGKLTDRAQLLADAKATKYDNMEYEDVKVTVFGNTAIATGASKAKGTDETGKPMDTHVRWTDLGEDAERQVAVRGESRFANQKLKNHTTVEIETAAHCSGHLFCPETWFHDVATVSGVPSTVKCSSDMYGLARSSTCLKNDSAISSFS
jgi:hypothetical protein